MPSTPNLRPMRGRLCAGAVAVGVLASASPAHADYPVMSHRYLADPGALVYDGRIYLYNSNDDDNETESYTMHSVVCVSTSDLKNWTDHGIVFQVPSDASWANNSWAPQPITRGGKIYLYFGNSGSGVGVAASESPTGGFKDAKGDYLVNSATPGAPGAGSWLFDPGALIDDDGHAYLSFGGGNDEKNARIIQLGDDLVSVSGTAVSVPAPGFFEASFLFKRQGKYYFAYSSDPDHGLRIDYLMSSSPLSGYTYAGVLADQPPVNGSNNHASEFEFKGQWYHAYHNRSVSTAAGIPTTYKRNLAIERLDFNDDGTVEQVTYTTDGVPQVGVLDPYQRVEAETFNAQSGVQPEPSSAGGLDLTQLTSGDWISLRGVDFGATGAKAFRASVASVAGGGSIALHAGDKAGPLLGTCAVPSTGGAQIWQETSCNVAGAAGVQDLVLTFEGTSFSVDYWQFTGADAGSAGGGGASTGSGGGASGSAGTDTSEPAGGASAAGASANGGPAGNTKNEGGCSCATSTHHTSPVAFGLGLSLAFAWRRRRATRARA